MKTFALSALATCAIFAGAAYSQQDEATCDASKACELPSCVEDCPTAQKVAGLLGQWDVASQQAAKMSPEANQAFAAKMGAATEHCPVGSRMGETMSVVNDTLAFLAASSEACAEACSETCPIESMDKDSEAYAQASQMKAARAHLITSLNQLSGFAAGATNGCCAASCDAAACETEDKNVTKQGDAETCETTECCTTSCPIRIASRLGAAKAGFAQAQKEVQALSPEARGKIVAGFGELAQVNSTVQLIPETVMALNEGLNSLNQIHAKMGEFMAAHPELTSELPKEAHLAMMIEMALTDEAAQVLTAMTATMGAMQSEVVEASAVIKR